MRPHIDRQIATGQPVVTAERPVMYARTSGTTGKPKLIPVTRRRHSQPPAGTARGRLCRSIAASAPSAGVCSRSLEPLAKRPCPDGTPAGATTGLIYQSTSPLIRAKYVLPAQVFEIEDYDLRYAVMARIAAQYGDISVIATANPSTILRLLHEIETGLPRIADELEHGGSSLAAKLPAGQAATCRAHSAPRRNERWHLRALITRGGSLTIGECGRGCARS